MIKLLSLLVAIHGVFSAPVVLFTQYGLPGDANLAEKSLPFAKLQPIPPAPSLQYLPGAKNHNAKSQLPGNLPGTRNLDEKSIPDSVTLKKIPLPLAGFELPSHPYVGGFTLSGGYKPLSPSPVGIQHIKIQQKPPAEYQAPIYPNSTPGGERNSEKNAAPNTEGQNPINLSPDSKIKLQDIHGQYSHGFSNLDGTQVEESGHLISTDDGWEYVIAKEGSYRYISPEGIPISVRYIADDKGFRILSQSFGSR